MRIPSILRGLRTRLVPAGVVLVVLAVSTASCTSPAPRGSDPPTPAPAVQDSSATDAAGTSARAGARTRGALRVLAAWDSRRSEALARQDRAALAELYAPGTGLLQQDLALVEAYERREVRVVDVTTQLRELEVLAAGSNRLRLRVVERLAGVGYRTADHGYRRLPGSPYDTRVLTLRRSASGWRLSSATPG